MNALQLRDKIIIPTLRHLSLFSESAVRLLLGTAAVESDMGSFISQVNGPALGIYQMEPSTYNCIYDNFLAYRPLLSEKITKYKIPDIGVEQLSGNLYYATSMARIKYYRSPRALPDKNDVKWMAMMWKNDYNSVLGKGTVDKFIEKYNKHVLPCLED